MIKFSEEDGFIKAHGFKHREGQDKILSYLVLQ